MHRSMMMFLLTLGLPTVALAGPNAGGTLLVHATPPVEYTSDSSSFCGLSETTAGCEWLSTNLPSGPGTPHVWWVVAAFPPTSSPRLEGVVFGVDYSADSIVLVDFGSCAGGLEIPYPNWPAPLTGTAVTWAEAQLSLITEVYWFAGYEYSFRDLTFRLGTHPTQGASFADDAVPSNLDPVADFGRLGFGGARGYLPCPDALGACCLDSGGCEVRTHADCGGEWLGSNVGCDPTPCTDGACCLETGVCRILGVAECKSGGGTHGGPFTSCEPEPCLLAVGACCLPGGSCRISTEPDCHLDGGSYVWPGTTCDPNPCDRALYEVTDDGSGDLPTIQASINAAGDGAIIELMDGTYTGFGNREVDFSGKAVTVRSRSGDPARCVIECQSLGRGFVFRSGESRSSILQSVSVRDGRNSTGGAIFLSGSSPRVIGCVFTECLAETGGALFAEGAYPLFEKCVFLGNTAFLAGGAVYANFGHLVFRESTFSENVGGEIDSGGGGAIVVAFGLVTVDKCTLWRNSGYQGGAFGIGRSTLHLLDSTIAENTAAFGSAVYSSESTVSIKGSILAFNHGGAPFSCTQSSSQILSCCDVFGNDGGNYVGCLAAQNGIRGNISMDPLFCDAPGGDFHLRPGSPCLPKPWGSISSCGLIGAHGLGCGAGGDADIHAKKDAAFDASDAMIPLVHPNPSHGEITLSFRLGEPSRVRIDLYDVFGRRITRMLDERLDAGRHTLERDIVKASSQGLPAGVYYVRMSDGRSTTEERVVVVR